MIYSHYNNSHSPYDKGVRPADLIHLHILGFQHNNKAETDNVKTHAAYQASTGYGANQQDLAPEKQTVEGEAEKLYEYNVGRDHAGTNSQERQQIDASSAATADLQRKSNTNRETRASVEDNSKKDDKLTDGVNKGSEDENNYSDLSKPMVNSSFHNGNGVNITEEKSSASNQHGGNSEPKDGTINQKDRGIQERRAVLKLIVSEYGLDIIAVNTAKKNEAKANKEIELFKENRKNVLAQNLTTKEYIKRIDAGLYDDGYAIVCERIRRDKYEGYRFTFLDIDRKDGVSAFLDTGDRKITLEELADRQYVEFNGVDRDQRIHIPYLLEPDAEIATKGADDKLGIEVNVNGVMFGAGSPHHNGGFYERLGKAIGIKILDKTQAFTFQEHIASICQQYGVNYFSGHDQQEKEKFYQAYTAHLHDDSTRIRKGGRHEVIKFICCSYFTKYADGWGNLTDDQRFERVLGYDKKYCEPPLYETDPQEVRDLWEWTKRTLSRCRDEQKEARSVHDALLRQIELLIIRNYPTTPLEEIKEWCIAWSKKHCDLDEDGFEKQWNSALNRGPVGDKIAAVAAAAAAFGGKGEGEGEGEEVPPSPDLEAELASKIPDRNYAEFLVQTVQCTVKQEESLIRQIVYTAMSKDTRDPINLAVIAPTSEGKTYAILETIQYFPKEDIRRIGSMSPKVIIRDNGVLVDSNNQPVTGRIKELKKKIEEEKFRRKLEERARARASKAKKPSKDVEEEDDTITVEIDGEKNNLENMQEQLERLNDDARMLINLSGKLLVFLEPPDPHAWPILKAILSHDAYEIEHPYVYDAGKGFKVKKVVTIGWPACIFCSAKNESSSWPMWPEIQSRFLVVSPNMVPQKYSDGNMLIAQKMGLPSHYEYREQCDWLILLLNLL